MILLVGLELGHARIHGGASTGPSLLLLHPRESDVVDALPLPVLESMEGAHVLRGALILYVLPVAFLGRITPVVLGKVV